MPHFTVDQLKQAAIHLRQESIRLRKSNPELSERIGKGAIALKKIAEYREKQALLVQSSEARDDAVCFDDGSGTQGRDASQVYKATWIASWSARVDEATQDHSGSRRNVAQVRDTISKESGNREPRAETPTRTSMGHMSWKLILAGAVALTALWMADVGTASEYAWLTLAFIGISLSVVAVYCGALFGVVWLWNASYYARIGLMVCAVAFGVLWLIGMASDQFDRGPLDCGGPTMAGFVC